MAVPQGIFQMGFAKKETSYGTPLPFIATDAFEADASGIDISGEEERTLRDDMDNVSRGYKSQTQGRRTAAFNIPKFLMGGGSLAAAPDDLPLWETVFTYAAGGTATTVSGATTTTAVLADSTGFAENRGIVIDGEARLCTDLTTVSAVTTITWAPPLSEAPADGTAITTTGTLYMSNNNTTSASIWQQIGDSNAGEAKCKCISGAVVAALNIKMSGGESATVTHSGVGKETSLFENMITGTLTDAADLSLSVYDNRVGVYVSGEGLCYYQIEDEVVCAIYGSDDTDIVTLHATSGRGQFSTDAAAHTNKDADVYFPNATTGGEVIAGVLADIYWGANSVTILDISIDIEPGVELRNNELGTESATEKINSGKFTVRYEANAYNEDGAIFIAQLSDTQNAIFAQAGEDDGSIVAVYMPQCCHDSPKWGSESDKPTQTVTGNALESATGNDAIFILFA